METDGRPRQRRAKDQRREPLSMRITPDIRERLVAQAKAQGRSITQEGEFRLEQSFLDDAALGGPRTAALLRILGSLSKYSRDDEWLDDRSKFNEVRDKWLKQLDLLKPTISEAQQQQNRDDLEWFRALIEEEVPPHVEILRRIARQNAANPQLDPEIREEWAAMGKTPTIT
jgi:hypothetical protein